MDDAHTLDPSVEAFIARQQSKRNDGLSPVMFSDTHGAPRWIEAYDHGVHGGTLRIEYGHSVRHTAFMPYPLARDLAAAMNAVLMRHADAERPAHERVRDIDVTAADGKAF